MYFRRAAPEKFPRVFSVRSAGIFLKNFPESSQPPPPLLGGQNLGFAAQGGGGGFDSKVFCRGQITKMA